MDLYYIGMILYIYGMKPCMILYIYGMKPYHICIKSYGVKLCLTAGGVQIFTIFLWPWLGLCCSSTTAVFDHYQHLLLVRISKNI